MLRISAGKLRNGEVCRVGDDCDGFDALFIDSAATRLLRLRAIAGVLAQ